MGGAVVRVIGETPGAKLVAAVDRPGSQGIGKDAGELAGVGNLGLPVIDRIPSQLKGRPVIIDFSRPDASVRYLKQAATKRWPIVIGTTGFNNKQWSQIKGLARQTQALVAPNMSVGVNLLLGLLGPVAQSLGQAYDVELVEVHHRFKKDAPSGTALALGHTIAKALGRDLDRVGTFGRKGLVGERGKEEIGLSSVRAGDVVGEHTVIFGGLGERLEFVHRAQSRETFARGAVRAAQWIIGKKNGLYTMQDLLKLQPFG